MKLENPKSLPFIEHEYKHFGGGTNFLRVSVLKLSKVYPNPDAEINMNRKTKLNIFEKFIYFDHLNKNKIIFEINYR